jgi:hypothetical protein
VVVAKIPIDGKIKKFAEDFAERVFETNKKAYARRGQANKRKILHDNVVGKTGEIAVYKFLKGKGKNPSKPDFKIYTAKKKSYDADMYLGNLDLHIKTQHVKSAKKFGLSWVFQKKDPLFKKCKATDVIVLCLYKEASVTIMVMKPAKDLFPFLKPPKKEELSSKVCLYYDDIKNL